MANCWKCGYDLAALPSGAKCPECGAPAGGIGLGDSELARARAGLVAFAATMPVLAVLEIALVIQMPNFYTMVQVPVLAWLFLKVGFVLGVIVLLWSAGSPRWVSRLALATAVIGLGAAMIEVADQMVSSRPASHALYSAAWHVRVVAGWIRLLVLGPVLTWLAVLALAGVSRFAGDRRVGRVARATRLWLAACTIWASGIVGSYVLEHQIAAEQIRRQTPPNPLPTGGFRVPPAPPWVALAGDAHYVLVGAKNAVVVGSFILIWGESLLLLVTVRRKS